MTRTASINITAKPATKRTARGRLIRRGAKGKHARNDSRGRDKALRYWREFKEDGNYTARAARNLARLVRQENMELLHDAVA